MDTQEHAIGEEISQSANLQEDQVTTETQSVESATEQETYSAEDYKKALQSSASKAKFAILQELGIKNVNEFKAIKSKYDEVINNSTAIEQEKNDLKNQINKLNESLVLEKLQVSEEYKDDFLALAKTKVNDEKSFEDVSRELLKKYPQWSNKKQDIKIGTDKSDQKTKIKNIVDKYYGYGFNPKN